MALVWPKEDSCGRNETMRLKKKKYKANKSVRTQLKGKIFQSQKASTISRWVCFMMQKRQSTVQVLKKQIVNSIKGW